MQVLDFDEKYFDEEKNHIHDFSGHFEHLSLAEVTLTLNPNTLTPQHPNTLNPQP